MQRTATVAALALAASLALAAPAVAKPTAYAGKTNAGDTITFKRSGKGVRLVNTLVPTSCVSAHPGAVPQSGSESFQPPGRLALGRQIRLSALQESALHYADVTKNYRFKARKKRNGTIAGRLHVNFSYQALTYGSYWMLVPVICQGDATFRARPVAG